MTKPRNKLPTYYVPVTHETLSKHGVALVCNELLSLAEDKADKYRVRMAHEPRDNNERALGHLFKDMLQEICRFPKQKKTKAKRAASKSARKHSRGSKP